MRVTIKGFEGYDINELGEIRSKSYNKTNQIKILKQNNGYCMLHNKGFARNIKVGRLVAQAFLGLNIRDKTKCVIHEDGNRMNNRMDNLKLGTKGDGQKHYLDNNKLITHKKRRSSTIYKMQTEDIIERKLNGQTLSQMSLETGWSISYLSMICNGKRRVYKNEY